MNNSYTNYIIKTDNLCCQSGSRFLLSNITWHVKKNNIGLFLE